MSVILSPEAVRVLGCLMEKAATTPDHYPLSVNAIIAACNQSTNREPVVVYDEATVEQALDELRAADLARRIKATGQRVVKHRHVVDERLGLAGPERAVLGVLLLRGEQTPGELKARTERWHGFRSVSDLEAALARLEADGLVVRRERRPGQKEARWATTIVGGTDGAAPVAPAVGASAIADPILAPGPAAAHSLAIVDPATGQTMRSVAVTEPGEVTRKVAAARTAGAAWAARPYAERAAALGRFAVLLAEEAEECARITTSEVGKPIREARNEVRAVQERIAWNIEHVGPLIAPRTVTADGPVVERVTSEPVGVVAHISAWNYPYFTGLNTIVPALLAGNAVLYKPSEHATLTGLRLVDLLHRAGVPIEAVQAVVGAGDAGAALVAADVDMICFTGSYATGRRVAAAAAERLRRVQLELGGKDAAYVCDDVDVAAVAASVAEGACYNAGQSCAAIERVYVHRAVADRFVDALVAVVAGYRVGDPTDEATDVGPLARVAQIGILAAQVADARARGAEVRCGGEAIDRPGNWFAPTVLAGCDDTMAVMREESFGPVVPVAIVADDDEALARMDDTEYGLGAAVFSADRERAERILARLDVGNAYWNASDRSCVRLPWSGRRHSGVGVSMGEAGVRALVREKAWHLAGA